MYKDKKILGIITARGGSKGLPKKNVRNLLGKPLIAWSIEHAIKSKYVDDVLISTDSKEIADVALKYGAKVPFLRPAELASDTASSIDVIKHAIQYETDNGKKYDIIVLLEPTSPLREISDIDKAIEMLIEHPDARSITGICDVESQHPDFLVALEKGIMKPYIDFEVKRRQDLSQLYFFEGSVYASYIDTFFEESSFYHNRTLGYIVPKWKSFEIDDIVDFFIVEKLLEEYKKGNMI